MKALPVGLLVAAVLAGGCSHLPLPGDRLFEAGRLEEAAIAYGDYLAKHSAAGQRGERALYRLGLTHAFADSPVYDLDKAQDALERLIEAAGTSPYGRQASLVLGLQLEVARLRRTAAAQMESAAQLEQQLGQLAAAAATAASAREHRARQLTSEIAALRAQVEHLTKILGDREAELEQIKRIDLERQP